MDDAPTTSPDLPPAPEIAARESQVVHIVVEAVYEDGVIKPLVPLELPAGTPISLQITACVTATVVPGEDSLPAPRDHSPGSALPAAPALAVTRPRIHLPNIGGWLKASLPSSNLLAAFTRADMLLLAFGLLIYSLTRFIGLTLFPIYFFCDEAIQTNLASDLLLRGFRDHTGTLLPPFFLNDQKWSLSFSVYIQLLSVVLFGKSVFVTRATSVLVSMLGAAAVALTLKLIFRSRSWWAGVLVLAIAPAWFLHSRTAFETVMMVSFYACFLCAYLLYRYRDPRYLYAALLFGAATFYSYTNGQGVMLISGVLLLLTDWRYHLSQKRRLILGAVLMLVLLTMPLLRFRFLHPDAQASQLRSLYSYWFQPIGLGEKLTIFGGNYLQGLSPGYWFLPNDVDLERHRMKGMGHLPLISLPFVLIGLAICLRQWRSSAHRAILIALLAAPFSSAIVGIAITRALAMVVPATLLTCLGFDQVLTWLRRRVPYAPLAVGCGALLSIMSFGMLRTALVDGPTWYSDYGLGGMQYGAQQLFTTIPEELAKSPDTHLHVSPNWANNPNVFPVFFLNEQQSNRVDMINVDAFLFAKRDLDPSQLFVMTADEYQRAAASQKFVLQPPERIMAYPDGQPGFYFVRMCYVDNIDTVFATERQARQVLQEDAATLDGQQILVRHSLLDTGRVADVFDADDHTLMRGLEANPLIIELVFPSPRTVGRLGVTVASMDFSMKVITTPADGSAPRDTSMTYHNLPADPHVDLTLPGGTQPVSKLRIEITNLNQGEVAHIHVREVSIK
jgi:dolichyl-phosphate-mannose-protein mannosyltransferase/AF2212-like protein